MKSIPFEISNLVTKQEGEELIAKMQTVKMGISPAYIDEFKRAFLKSAFVKITLAYFPERNFLLKLKKWFSDNLGSDVLLDLSIDENIVGGAIVICQNHYRDYSLGSVVEKLIAS